MANRVRKSDLCRGKRKPAGRGKGGARPVLRGLYVGKYRPDDPGEIDGQADYPASLYERAYQS